MTFQELKALIENFVTNDPSPLAPEKQATIISFLNRESINFGFSSWAEAYQAPDDAR